MSGPAGLRGAAPLQRARFLALAYRDALGEVDPAAQRRIDWAAREAGETWASASLVTYDLNDWLSAAEAAHLAAVGPATLRLWRRRGRLVQDYGPDDPGDFRRTADGRFVYLASSVLAMATQVRQRARKAS